MSRGLSLRGVLIGTLFALLFSVNASRAHAQNPSLITIHHHPNFEPSATPYDYSGDWRSLCSPGATNIVRWYTSDDVLQSRTPNAIDCSIGLAPDASGITSVPGSIPLWQYRPNFIPASLPLSGGNTGVDADFYLTLTSASSSYVFATNPRGLTIIPNPFWGDGSYSAGDRSEERRVGKECA